VEIGDMNDVATEDLLQSLYSTQYTDPALGFTHLPIAEPYGNTSPDIVFVGCMRQQGREILYRSIEEAKINVQKTYYTDLFKVYMNREPTWEEVRKAAYYLFQELQILGPKVVVPLGPHVYRPFQNGTPHYEAMGTPHEIGPLWIVPTAYPVAAEYLWDDGVRMLTKHLVVARKATRRPHAKKEKK
jgi:uracil-DNA glycosylase